MTAARDRRAGFIRAGRSTSGNPYADCLGIAVDATEFSLWLSPHILDNTAGGVIDPPVSVHDCDDDEGDRILDLVHEVGALLLVSEDTDLTSMSPWRGTPILRPREFAAKVDGMRRHRRR